MKTTQTTAGGVAAGGGGYGIYESTSYWDGFATNIPLMLIAGYVAILVLGFICFSLWKRVKALEGK